MGNWFKWRIITITLLLIISVGIWYLLDGFTYRMLFSTIPLLFALQVSLSDTLESLLTSRLNYKTKWFTLFIAPGTILHELCHLLAALATGCTITKAALFKPNPKTGVLGFVNYLQPDDKWLVLREFIVGFAPFFGCGLLLFLVNIPYGGGLISLVDDKPITHYEQFQDLGYSIVSAVTDSFNRINFSKPIIWFFIYLQLCFTVGAAPSTVDFKGAFSSLWRHIFAALTFIILLALVALLSQEYFDLGGLEEYLSYGIGVFLKFTVIVLLLSTALIVLLIPVVYLGTRLTEIRGIAKTIPVTTGFLTFYFMNENYDLTSALAGAAIIFTTTLMALILTNQPKQQKRK